MRSRTHRERATSQRRRLLPLFRRQLLEARARLAATLPARYESLRDYRRVRALRLGRVRRLLRQIATLESGRLLSEWHEVSTPACCERCGLLIADGVDANAECPTCGPAR